MCYFLRQRVSSNFGNIEKLIPFVYGGTNMSFEMQDKAGQLVFS